MSKSETYAKIIVDFIQEGNKIYFTNNFTTKKMIGLKGGQLREGIKKLQKIGILRRYRRGCYKIDRTLIKK